MSVVRSPWLALLPLSISLTAHADKPRAVVAVAPPGDKQPALAVGFDESGALRARVCAALPCTLAGATDLGLPDEARALAAKAQLAVMRIAPARRVITVEIEDAAHQRSWQAVAAAPLDGSGQVKLLFQGWTGLIDGEFGLRHGPLVQRGVQNADGSYSVVIGEQREDLTLCGRPTIIAPKLVAPDLSLKPAKVQRLQKNEREHALEVEAKPLASDAPVQGYRLLRAVGASSAVGSPSALTDGDPKTTWAENRGAEGRGEFVQMDAPSELPISGFDVVFHPPGAAREHAVAPEDFWLATNRELIHVTVPKNAWKEPGARFEIALPQPMKSDCLALVTEDAQSSDKDAEVTFAELSARTEFDASTVDGLVGALAGGGERAEAAAEALRALGTAAIEPIAKAFGSLDEGGRRVALDVIDQAPCSASAPLYVRALTGPYRAQRIHARERLRNCGADAAAELGKTLAKAPLRQRPLLVSELALVAPDAAVREGVPLLSKLDRTGRRLLRKALAWATRDPRARPEIERMLADASLSEVATIDLLRALGERVKDHSAAARQALGRLTRPGASFRTRYLLVAPAAELASTEPVARAYLAQALTRDESQYVRAEAARRVPRPEAFQAELLAALDDTDVRVREASVTTLKAPSGTFASGKLVTLLRKDHWPLVRSAVATALAHHAPSSAVDSALADALGDESPLVRAPVLLALGERRAVAHADAVRERLSDRDEVIEVRSSAALALGLMCDAGSVDLLTDLARKLRDPGASAEARALGPLALGALGRIHPADLPKRLAPLLTKETPSPARQAAEAALRAESTCGRRALGAPAK